MARHDHGVTEYRLADGSVRYRVRLSHGGRRYKWSGFANPKEAALFYLTQKQAIRTGEAIQSAREAAAGRVADLIDAYLAQATNKRNVGGERVYGAFWTTWLGTERPEHVSAARIDRARTHLLQKGHCKRPLTHATVNRYVAWLHHLFKLEVDADRLTKNPCAIFVRSVRQGGQKFTEPKAPEEEFSREEEAALARELGPYADVPTLAILTGLRQEELFGLQWPYLDLTRGRGRLPATKGGETQYVPLSQQAVAILRRLKVQARGSPWVFPHPRHPLQPVNAASWYAHVFKPAAVRAGIVLSRKSGKTFHTLRHTFASRLQDEGANVDEIKAAGRWKTWRAMERYLKRKDARVSALVHKLGAVVPKWSREESEERSQNSETKH